jgi:hypothetical protein
MATEIMCADGISDTVKLKEIHKQLTHGWKII